MTRGGRFIWSRVWCPIGFVVARASDGLWAEGRDCPVLPWFWWRARSDLSHPILSVKLGEYMWTFRWKVWK
jgi:hypothetical protein